MGSIEFFKNGKSVARTDFLEPNLNLLAHAQSIELEIGSRCGGHGVCGGDRVKILPESQGQLSPITDAERERLMPSLIKNGYRLACQCFPDDATGAIKVEFFIAVPIS